MTFNLTDSALTELGPPIGFVFTAHVDPSGDPHADAEALDRADRDAARFVFSTRLLSGVEWERLIGEHPPINPGDDYNPTTFVPALIQRSVIGYTVRQPGADLERHDRPLTDDEVNEIWETWPQWARKRFADTLISANLAQPPAGKARRASSTLSASVALGASAVPTSPTPPTTTE